MLIPSDTETVANSRGVPPASAIPSLAAATWKSWVILQGVCSPFMLTTPIIGFAIEASSRPIARRKARCGARSNPSVVTRDRHFFIYKNLLRRSGRRQDAHPTLRWKTRLFQRSNDRRVLELRD